MLKECIIGLFGVITGGAIGYFTKKKVDKKKIKEAEKKLTMAYKVYNTVSDTEKENRKDSYKIWDEREKIFDAQMELWQERQKLEETIDELQMLKYDAEMQEMMETDNFKERELTIDDVNKLISEARKLIIESRDLFSDEDDSKDCYYYADDENLLNIKIERA